MDTMDVTKWRFAFPKCNCTYIH